ARSTLAKALTKKILMAMRLLARQAAREFAYLSSTRQRHLRPVPTGRTAKRRARPNICARNAGAVAGDNGGRGVAHGDGSWSGCNTGGRGQDFNNAAN